MRRGPPSASRCRTRSASPTSARAKLRNARGRARRPSAAPRPSSGLTANDRTVNGRSTARDRPAEGTGRRTAADLAAGLDPDREPEREAAEILLIERLREPGVADRVGKAAVLRFAGGN